MAWRRARSIWFCRLQSLAFTILFSICIILVMLVLVIGPVLWSYIQPMLDVPGSEAGSTRRCRYSVAVALLYLVVALLYRWLPSRHLPLREILPGAAVTVVLWVVASLFSWYLQNLQPLLRDLQQSRRHRRHAAVLLRQRDHLHLRRRDQQRPPACRGGPTRCALSAAEQGEAHAARRHNRS